MDFGEIFSKAWKIVWNHKILWLFGLLAGCSARGGGGSGSGMNYSFGQRDFGNGPDGMPPFMREFANFFENLPAWVYVLFAIAVLMLVLLGLFLGAIGRIGLVRGTAQADDGAQRLTLSELWNGSLPYFWRVFWLNALIMVAVIVIFLIVLIPGIILTTVTLGLGIICLIPLICVLAIAAWLLGVVVEQSIVAIVTENLGVMDGLARGWKVVRANLGSYVVMALIVAVGGGIVGFLIAIPVLFIMVPIFIGMLSQTDAMMSGGVVVAGILFLLYLPFALLFGAVLQAYIGAVWTLVFRRLSGKKQALSVISTNPPPAAPPEPPKPASEPEPPPALPDEGSSI